MTVESWDGKTYPKAYTSVSLVKGTLGTSIGGTTDMEHKTSGAMYVRSPLGKHANPGLLMKEKMDKLMYITIT